MAARLKVGAIAFALLCSLVLHSELPDSEEIASLFSSAAPKTEEANNQSYTINYNTISIIEYIRFASKICNTNFIFNEEDLNFTVTVVSDGPITSQNVMATLIQVLRIHGLSLLEQENNLVIHKSPEVTQIATLVTGKGEGKNAPIVTRIFRIKEAKVDSIAGVIKPMISSAALLETLPETKQLILTDVTANVDKVEALIDILDAPVNQLSVRTYKVLHNAPDHLVELTNQIMNPIVRGAPFILVAQPAANAIYIVSTGEILDKTVSVLTSLDVPPSKEMQAKKPLKAENIFVYAAINRPSDEILRMLRSIGENLQKSGIPEGDLIDTIEAARSIKETNSITFAGSKDSIAKIKEFLAAIDVPGAKPISSKTSFFVYRPKNRSAKQIDESLKELGDNLKGTASGEGLVEVIKSAKINNSTNTLLFSGEESQFAEVMNLLNLIDTAAPGGSSSEAGGFSIPVSNQFLVYKPKNQTSERLIKSIQEFVHNLKMNELKDPALLHSLDSVQHIKNSDSLLFTGDAASLQRVSDLLTKVDLPLGAKAANVGKVFWMNQPKYVSKEKEEGYLKQVASSLEPGNDDGMIEAIQSMKWIAASQSFLFQGTPAGIARLKELLQNFDTPESKPGYYLYKLQSASGEAVEEDLDQLSKDLNHSDAKDDKVLHVLENIRYVKETNSLLLTGDPEAIEEVKGMIAGYDYPRAEKIQISSNFFMYKPQHMSASHIETSLKDTAESLKKAGLADPQLLNTIASSKYVETTNSLIFTGNADSIQKVQSLLKDIDVPQKEHKQIQHIGKTTFLLYKLKVAGGPQIMTSIKTMLADLKKTGGTDPDLIQALSTMKYVKETNSLFFTGTEQGLEKVQELVEQFDVTSLAAPSMAPERPAQPGQENFYLYKAIILPVLDLEKHMTDFAENVRSSGLTDPELFSAISSMRVVEKTQSIIFTGTPKALAQVKELLTAFDVPSNLANKVIAPTLESSIQAIDNTSFLVYKLQFHKGDEIQSALKQISKDLLATSAPVNVNLLNSINSIQWLDVTNSLLCSGDQETLIRLKELIKNLDVPLKQVFIEILVIETSLSNALLFGLEWGGNYMFNNRFGISSFNTPAPVSAQGTFPDTFISKLSGLTTPQPPTPIGNIPPSPGFDLGVIGEVIKHNGSTFLTLGSLLNALQADNETTIITAPKILGQDGRTSSIFSGSNIPFAGSFVNNTTSGATVQTSNIEYRDIGLNLTITPVLGNSDIVTLDINLDRSQTVGSVSGAVSTQNLSANGIITSKTTMQTTVHVPDRNFLVLSGFVNNSNTKTKQGIPCLGGLPMIGAAFSQQNDTISNQNVVIFLRPFIINSIDDMRRITSEQEQFFRDLSSTPFLEHNFDDAMETIKSVDDD
jgi:type II secretory pathway component GspD/PulD (secretin)